MQSALVSVPLGSTPPQHSSRPRRTTSGVAAFRTTEGEVGSFSRGSSSFMESGSWRSGPIRSTSASETALISTRSIPKSASFVKVEGFDAPSTGSAPTSPPLSPGKDINRASSLLSRQLSVENLGALHRTAIPIPDPSLVERLEASVRGEPAVKPTTPSLNEPDAYLSQLQSQFPVFTEPLVVKSYSIARAAHPAADAFNRCTGAAIILAELGADELAVSAALLHDIFEISSMTEPLLKEMLGNEEALSLVKRVSHMGYMCQKYRTASNTKALSSGAISDAGEDQGSIASHVVGMLVAHGPPRALLVRLAIALQEARSVDAMRPPTVSRSIGAAAASSERLAKRNLIAAESLEVWAPLANRLGVWSLKAELEDKAFRILKPAEYAELRDRLEAVQEPTQLIALVDTLRAQLQTMGVEYLDLSGRPKHLWGVWKKMVTKGYSADQVRDVRGLRVIVKSREDCYLALRAVEKAWNLVGESKNYIKTPKTNGYQSLHAVADPGDGHLVEIQIRTDKMHYLAEYGAEAAHWRYKEGSINQGAVETGSGSPPAAAESTREANWAKFMTAQQIARDKKCRPSGSPSGDQSLASIIASMDSGSSSEGDDEAIASQASTTKGRSFQEYIAASGQRPAPPEEQRNLVAVVAGGAFSVAELPVGTTLGNLLKSCGPEIVARSLHVVVNRAPVTEASAVLNAGDIVELFVSESTPVSSPTTAAPPTTPAVVAGNMVPLVGGLAKKLASVDINKS